jgi:hypothetical protein
MMRKQQVSERCKKALLAVINSIHEHRDASRMRYHSKKLAPKWQELAAQAIADGFVCPKVDYLCEATGYSNRQVREARIQLIEEGRLDAFPTKICYLMWVKVAETRMEKNQEEAGSKRQVLPPIVVLQKNHSVVGQPQVEGIAGKLESSLCAQIPRSTWKKKPSSYSSPIRTKLTVQQVVEDPRLWESVLNGEVPKHLLPEEGIPI